MAFTLVSIRKYVLSRVCWVNTQRFFHSGVLIETLYYIVYVVKHVIYVYILFCFVCVCYILVDLYGFMGFNIVWPEWATFCRGPFEMHIHERINLMIFPTFHFFQNKTHFTWHKARAYVTPIKKECDVKWFNRVNFGKIGTFSNRKINSSLQHCSILKHFSLGRHLCKP